MDAQNSKFAGGGGRHGGAGKPGGASTRDRSGNGFLGNGLRRIYDDVLSEPIPDEMMTLLNQLAEKENAKK